MTYAHLTTPRESQDVNSIRGHSWRRMKAQMLYPRTKSSSHTSDTFAPHCVCTQDQRGDFSLSSEIADSRTNAWHPVFSAGDLAGLAAQKLLQKTKSYGSCILNSTAVACHSGEGGWYRPPSWGIASYPWSFCWRINKEMCLCIHECTCMLFGIKLMSPVQILKAE